LRATVWLVSSPLSSTYDSGTGDNLTRLPWHSLVQRPIKSASENVIISRMMQLAVPKQNGCQKCVVQLDTKANERRGSRFPIFCRLRCYRSDPQHRLTGRMRQLLRKRRIWSNL